MKDFCEPLQATYSYYYLKSPAFSFPHFARLASSRISLCRIVSSREAATGYPSAMSNLQPRRVPARPSPTDTPALLGSGIWKFHRHSNDSMHWGRAWHAPSLRTAQ